MTEEMKCRKKATFFPRVASSLNVKSLIKTVFFLYFLMEGFKVKTVLFRK